MYLLNYNQHKLYEILYSLFEEQNIYFAQNVIAVLQGLVKDKEPIATWLWNELDKANILKIDGEIKNVDSVHLHSEKPDFFKIEFLKPNKTKGKSEMKIGRLITAILNNMEKVKKFTPTQIETFVKKIYADVSNEKDWKLKLEEADKIHHYYLAKNYYKGGGNLSKSCMRLPQCQDFLNFYTDYCKDFLQILVLANDKDQIIGRALLWDTNKGKYLDRIYVTDDKDFELFFKWMKEHNVTLSYDKQTMPMDIMIKVKGWSPNINMPYLDTFEYGYLDDEFLYLKTTMNGKEPTIYYPGNKECSAVFQFRETDGGHELKWGSVFREGVDVDLNSKEIHSLESLNLPIRTKNCWLQKNLLMDLKGSPRTVLGDFDITNNNNLLSLEGGPAIVEHDYIIRCARLKSLEGLPSRKIGGDLAITKTPIASLKGCPAYIGGDFYIDSGTMEDLEGMPNKISGDITIENYKANPLKSLKGITRIAQGSVTIDVRGITFEEMMKGHCPEYIGDYLLFKGATFSGEEQNQIRTIYQQKLKEMSTEVDIIFSKS